MTNKYTFWELIKEYEIEIPIIQRDYVQGRENKGRVRDDFLNAIYTSLKAGQELHLDFIYGVIKKDKFIPLDGQQRLTTLFLLHYYLALKDDKFEEFQKFIKDKHNNSKFSYEIRESSREFCNKLVNEYIRLFSDIKTKKEVSISKIIKNQNWFFIKWEQDPTISAMLVMLDSIQDIFKEDNLFDKLKNITFSFLEPKELNIKNSDELYIKMNSRGKALNEFENFKSKFEDYIKDKNIKAKLDNEWLDIFWKLKEDKLKKESDNKEQEVIIENIFESYLNFFRNITIFFDLDNIEKIEDFDLFKFEYKTDNIEDIIKTLDNLCNYRESFVYSIREINIFEKFIAKKPSFSDRLRFYALMKFFIKVGCKKGNKKIFKNWIRVNINLINNMTDSFKNFKHMIKIIDKLSKDIPNLYTHISTLSVDNFQKEFESEKLKAKIIIDNPSQDWETEFIKAEKHWYLDGQIGFLLEFSKNDLSKFINYRDKFISLWDFVKDEKNEIIYNNQNLIHRALLTKGDYLPEIKSNYTFCSFSTNLAEKEFNWRKVFNDQDKNKYLKSLFDDSDFNLKDINSSLNTIIDKYSFKCDEWRSYLIKNPDYIKDCKNLQIRWCSDKEIYLLNKSQINGIHVELYTWDLFYKKFNNNIYNPFKKTKYKKTKSWEKPCIILYNWEYNSHNFAIDIKFIADKFNIEFFDRNENISTIPISIKTILLSHSFKLKDKRFINTKFELCQMDNILPFIKKLSKQLELISIQIGLSIEETEALREK